jgi:23S rRNA (adenine2030-N6)-methyltransferase
MLSYQHIYHAGNIVDCQKHAILSALFNLMNEDPAPYCYIDTHAGRGLYNLNSPEAQKIGEYKTGIDKIWTKKWPQEIRSYKDLLNKLNPQVDSKIYPGSPYIAYAHMRPTDTIELYEIHPQELVALDRKMGDLKNVQIYNMDGWAVLQEYLPPQEKRGLLLVDPSYELKEEYSSMVHHAQQAISLWPEGIYLIWYPILAAGRHTEMLASFKNSDIGNILQTEIYVDNEKGLQGTGMLLINAPAGFDTIVEKISKWLTISIGKSEKTGWLVR